MKMINFTLFYFSSQWNDAVCDANLNFLTLLIVLLFSKTIFFFSIFSFSCELRTIYFIYTEGPFQSDALLVPEGCLFDHIHNASRCWPFIRWNQTGAAACQERGMQMRSFAMLLPCGISLFSGVEFVCCPKHFKGELFYRIFCGFCCVFSSFCFSFSQSTQELSHPIAILLLLSWCQRTHTHTVANKS